MEKKTVILGASDNPERYSYLAAQRLTANHHPIVAIGRKAAQVGSNNIITDTPVVDDVDTVTLYLNPSNQKPYYNYILSLHPKRLIFNPGTENDELFQLALANQIQPIEACTLVLLATGQF